MRKAFLLFVLLIATSSIFAQVARELVLVEVGTGTGCGYCPGAAMGLEDLYDNGDPVAAIEYHSYNSGDPFNTPEAADRTSYYGISGYPTAEFDGGYAEVGGGSASSSMYSSYLPKVTARMAIPSEFSVEIYGDNTGTAYDVVVRVTKESAYAGTDLKVRFALTESDIPYTWQSMSEIDFTERLMAPDATGTAVSFANVGDQVDVNLTFTFNNSWVDANCELIAWIQDDADKYVLHSAAVDLLNLEPDVANANFTQSVETTCEGSTVAYTDLSTGAITSWNWAFEGGNPATSTDENPVVTYATQGDYDVSLEVSDGLTTSTLTQPNIITVIVPPAQPDVVVGELIACANSVYVYTAQVVPTADSYTWKVEPAAAGTITGNALEGTFTSEGDYIGDYTVSVRADNFCGDGTWSTPLTCTLNFTPAPFLLSEGGGICEGGSGIEITQNGSEVDVDYLLYLEGVYTGTTVAGTGDVLSFGVQDQEGVYSVVGEATNCELQMWGTPWIHYLDIPVQASQPAGEELVCNDQETSYNTNVIDNADAYVWMLTPDDAGVMTPDGAEVVVAWSNTFSGEAILEVAAENQCGMGDYSDELAVVLTDVPEPVIAGPAQTCDNTEEVYSTENHVDNTYNWVIEGGNLIDGAGTSQITVMWTNPGQGSVNLTENTPEDCSGMATEILVTIDNCTGVEDNQFGSMVCYPNPVANLLHVNLVLANSESITIHVVNSLGQVVYSKAATAMAGESTYQVNTSDFVNGYYMIRVTSANGNLFQQHFIKN